LVRQAHIGPKVKPVVLTRDKASRVHAFAGRVQNGAFRLRGWSETQVDPWQQELFDEDVAFPLGPHNDLLDASATRTAYLLDRPEPRVW
jgi:hypothetical protein